METDALCIPYEATTLEGGGVDQLPRRERGLICSANPVDVLKKAWRAEGKRPYTHVKCSDTHHTKLSGHAQTIPH